MPRSVIHSTLVRRFLKEYPDEIEVSVDGIVDVETSFYNLASRIMEDYPTEKDQLSAFGYTLMDENSALDYLRKNFNDLPEEWQAFVDNHKLNYSEEL